ncbi:N-acetylglucosamine kinase [uncultured Microbacterium sp.]|uniref:N-acetylglucosamine kinase n=1 Tax=uncultured Microbacterium sp. TaxID=191216 RepID=UPI0025D8DD13|nr:BadF/BadG/BcrA/BcrD ATPase family protein [uncultured Microbacterium sp.]
MGKEIRDRLVIGVDGGGTSTRAVVATAEGVCLGVGRAGSGNPISSGIVQAGSAVAGAVRDALAAAGATLGQVSDVVMAIAGHDSNEGPSDWILEPLRAEGFRGRLGFTSDLLAMYLSGSVAPLGYGIVGGTGASAVRVEEGRITATGDGLGWLLGDRGSGFWIGYRAAHAVIGELEGVAPPTALTALVLRDRGIDAAGIDTSGTEGRSVALVRLVRALYATLPVHLSRLAPLVFEASEAHDPVATEILRRAGHELVQTFEQVRTAPGPVVLGGGVIARPGPAQSVLRAHLAAAGDAHPLVLVDSGAVGATLLALRHAGVPVDGRILARLREGVAA